MKEIIDTKSSFADWLNNQNVRDELKFEIKVCLVKNGYPPAYSPEVFKKVMEQVENFEENHNVTARNILVFNEEVKNNQSSEEYNMMVNDSGIVYGECEGEENGQ